MKKSFLFFIFIIASFFFLKTTVYADNYYYIIDGKYKLCMETENEGKYNCAILEAKDIDQKIGDTIIQEGVVFQQTTQSTDANLGSISDIEVEDVCNEPGIRKPLKLIGTLVMLLKILIPVLIIIFGSIDLIKAVVASKDGINKAVKSIAIRIIAGIFIFFLPGIIQMILDWVNEWSNYENTWCCCTQCILDASNCDVNSCSSDSCKIGGMNS